MWLNSWALRPFHLILLVIASLSPTRIIFLELLIKLLDNVLEGQDKVLVELELVVVNLLRLVKVTLWQAACSYSEWHGGISVSCCSWMNRLDSAPFWSCQYSGTFFTKLSTGMRPTRPATWPFLWSKFIEIQMQSVRVFYRRQVWRWTAAHQPPEKNYETLLFDSNALD